MLMIHVNVSLQISRGIFVYGEIIKKHTKYTEITIQWWN